MPRSSGRWHEPDSSRNRARPLPQGKRLSGTDADVYSAASIILTNFRCASAILSSSRSSAIASREVSSACSVLLTYSRRVGRPAIVEFDQVILRRLQEGARACRAAKRHPPPVSPPTCRCASGDLRKDDLLRGHTAQVVGQAEFAHRPDRPFGGVELPQFDAVAVVVLELVVIVVVALAEGEQRHEERIPRAAPHGIRLVAKRVAGGVDEERAMLHGHHPRDAAKEEAAQGAHPVVPVRKTEQGREHESRRPRRSTARTCPARRRAGPSVDRRPLRNPRRNRA